MERKFYKVNEVAAMFGVHPNSVWRWIKQGKIKVSLIGGKKLIPAIEIERLERGE